MPTYEYECKACGHYYERHQAMSEDPDTLCPKCGGTVKRLISGGTGVIFKGSGFYVTDAKKSNPAASPVKKDETCAKPKAESCATCANSAKESV